MKSPQPPDLVRPRRRRGFTLVELMVAMALITILAGMALTGINSARRSAQLANTRGLVSRINEVIVGKWDEYRYRVLPVQYDTINTNYDPNSGLSPPQILPEEAARARLMMLRDLMRMEMPDRRSDLFDLSTGATTGSTTVHVIGTVFDTNNIASTQSKLGPLAWPPSPKLIGYQNKVIAMFDTDADGALSDTELAAWTATNESAECLFLVLSSTTTNGLPAMDMIAPYQIGDTDGDGMNEIVDSWGQPISWIRWPAGAPNRWGSGTRNAPIRTAAADEFDILGSDWGAKMESVELAYSLTPEVVSPGPDGILGLVTIEHPTTPYHTMTWPGNAASNSIGNHTFIDPYNREDSGGIGNPPQPEYFKRPGAIPDGGSRAVVADNVSSLDL